MTPQTGASIRVDRIHWLTEVFRKRDGPEQNRTRPACPTPTCTCRGAAGAQGRRAAAGRLRAEARKCPGHVGWARR